MIKIKLNSTYDWSKEYWIYTACKIWPRGDFLILFKHLKANFKEERNTLPIFTKYKMRQNGIEFRQKSA